MDDRNLADPLATTALDKPVACTDSFSTTTSSKQRTYSIVSP